MNEVKKGIKMKKIIFVMPSLNNGGAERSLVNLLNEIDSSKYNIDLLIFKENGKLLNQISNSVNILEPPESISVLYGNKINRLTFRKLGLLIFRYVSTLFSRLTAKLKKYSYRDENAFRWKMFYNKKINKLPKRYDIAISFLEGDTTYFVMDKIEAQMKISWIHNDYDSITKSKDTVNIDELYFGKYDNVISVSDKCVEILKNNFPKISEKFEYLPNIISDKLIKSKSNEYYPEEYKDVKKDETLLLSIGRLNYQKGFDIGIEAANILKNKFKFKWYIIGSGNEEKNLKCMIQKYNLENYVFLIGNRENPYPYIKNCDIVVQPSRYEGKSVVIDEAKILEKAMVITNYSTVKNQINDEALIVDINSKCIADGIERLILDFSLKNKYIQKLKKQINGNTDKISLYYDLFEK